MKVLFDADSMIYASCCNTEDLDYAITKWQVSLYDLKLEVEEFAFIENFLIFNGSIGNFRRYIGKGEYKSNRLNEKPPFLSDLHDYVSEHYEAISGFGVETDDVIAKYWTDLSKRYGRDEVMIVSVDKDYKQLPCLLYNYHYNHKTLLDITYDDARHNFYEQMVCGDASDGVNYLHGKGKAFCNKYFVKGESDYQYIRKTFQLFKDRYKSKAREKYLECYNLLRLKTY